MHLPTLRSDIAIVSIIWKRKQTRQVAMSTSSARKAEQAWRHGELAFRQEDWGERTGRREKNCRRGGHRCPAGHGICQRAEKGAPSRCFHEARARTRRRGSFGRLLQARNRSLGQRPACTHPRKCQQSHNFPSRIPLTEICPRDEGNYQEVMVGLGE
jgi:hypothetical protein